jgi:Smg protein
MFDILLYLFENIVNDSAEVWIDNDDLSSELQTAGFHDDDIYKALMWLEDLAELQSNDIIPFIAGQTSVSTRVYTLEESIKLDTQSQGFLLFLEQINLLDVATREMVIDRVMELEENGILLEDLKWVVLMVLFNVPGKELAFEQMENLVFDEPDGTLH